MPAGQRSGDVVRPGGLDGDRQTGGAGNRRRGMTDGQAETEPEDRRQTGRHWKYVENDPSLAWGVFPSL